MTIEIKFPHACHDQRLATWMYAQWALSLAEGDTAAFIEAYELTDIVWC